MQSQEYRAASILTYCGFLALALLAVSAGAGAFGDVGRRLVEQTEEVVVCGNQAKSHWGVVLVLPGWWAPACPMAFPV